MFDEQKVNGSVRPLATLLLVATYCYLAVMGKVPFDSFSSVVLLVVGFWFGDRSGQKAAAQVTEVVRQNNLTALRAQDVALRAQDVGLWRDRFLVDKPLYNEEKAA